MSKYHQGRYRPANPQKFEGDLNNIIYRSSWELRCLQFFDNNPAITKVMSEEIKIPYFNPLKRKPANYYPDFYIELTDKTGKVRKELIEVKPAAHVTEHANENTYTKLQRILNYAKWQAAVEWCKARDVNFRLLTETQIFGEKK